MDHFRTQFTVINDLDFDSVYEIKTVGKNTVGTSPESNVTEAFVAGNPVVGKLLKISFIAILNRSILTFKKHRMNVEGFSC